MAFQQNRGLVLNKKADLTGSIKYVKIWYNVSIIINCLILWKKPSKQIKIQPMHQVKKELIGYIIASIIGSAGESFAILNNAWHYTNPEILNIPAWLPFLWGLVGITGITFYKGLTEE